MIEKGDLVRIIQQPPNQFVKLVGVIGIVTDIQDEYADIDAIVGTGTIPLSCLSKLNETHKV